MELTLLPETASGGQEDDLEPLPAQPHAGRAFCRRGKRRKRAIAVALALAVSTALALVFRRVVMGGGDSKYAVPPADEVLRNFGPPGTSAGSDSGSTVGGASGLPRRTSVLVWNMQKEQNGAWPDAFPTLAAGRDLMVLQEVHLKAGIEAAMLGDGPLEYTLATQFVYQSDGSPTGVAIGAAARPLTAVAQVTPDTEPIVGTPKAALIAEYRVQGSDSDGSGDGGSGDGESVGSVMVVTVHGINRAAVEAFERQVDRITAALATHSGPVILAGDFNTQSARKTDYLYAAAAKLGLTAVTFDPDDRTLSKLSRRPLDHAFVRGADVDNTACWPDVGGSDHVAMSFDVTFHTPTMGTATATGASEGASAFATA